MDAKSSSLVNETLNSAFDLLRRMTPEHDLLRLAPMGPAAVYTTLVTLWMMTLQRLDGGSSLVAVVKDVLEHSKSLLPNNKRVREGSLSSNSGAFSEARKRLPLEVVEFFAKSVCRSLMNRSPSWFDAQRAFIIDGTTFTVSPTSELKLAFPPATNQHGVSVWPVLMLLVAHELQSGCALIPEIGAMYGEDNTSEARMAAALAGRLPPRSIVFADSGFGIFSVAHAMIGQGHDILFRMTKSRFKKLRRRAELIERTESASTYRVRWAPSDADRRTNPELPLNAVLEVLLHEVTLPKGDVLLLVTTLPYRSDEAAEAYSYRYDVEHDIRDLKVTLGLEKIRAKSEEMVRKELLCSVVAYNLVQEFRREAAKIANLPPRRLSFTGVWTTFRITLMQQAPADPAAWRDRYEKALKMAAKDKLPNRPGRSYPRRAHKRCPKSTKFMRSTAAPQPPASDPREGPPTN